MGIVYEWVILFAVIFFFGYAFSTLTQFKGAPGYGRLALQIWMYLVLGAYFSYFWSRGRRSLPMKTLNLAVVTVDREPLTVIHAFVRYTVVALLLFLPLALAKTVHPAFALLSLAALITTPFDRQRRGLHDMICGTLLLVTPDPPKRN